VTIHPQAQAFDDVAASYERGRPGYPVELIEWMTGRGLLGEGRTAIDLGAGTGKLTRPLMESGARVIAVEPLAAMRAELSRVHPDAEALEGTAEAIPVESGIADTVTCGMAFHWFANDIAFAEIARVLRTAGELVIVTNGFEQTTPLQRRVVQMRSDVQNGTGMSAGTSNWREVIGSSERFAFAEEVSFHNEVIVDLEGMLDRVRSSSPIARLPEQRRLELLDELRAMVDDEEHIDLSQRTRALSYVRR
jgi:ubiquinone/menaquinone biosynthesis C-methylase UbiE